METGFVRKMLILLGVFLAVWLGLKYLLPVVFPFLLGGVLALAAEPGVRFGVQRLHLPRAVATGLGVSLTLILLVGIVSLLGALAVKELGVLAGALPDVQQTVQQGMTLLQDNLVNLAQGMPDGVRTVVTGGVLELFDSSSVLLEQAGKRLPGVVTSVLGWLPNGALSLGTGVLSGFMISARLPRLRQRISCRIPDKWKNRYLPMLGNVRRSLWEWLKAQGKLMAVTYGVVALGLTVVGVRYGLFWAVLVAVVDAVPILGTGTVLIPWAVVELLRGGVLRGIGLLITYAAALLLRTVLEPRLVGRHLGLDPLLTLLFLYVGYRFWGILGMILAPMLAAAANSITENPKG